MRQDDVRRLLGGRRLVEPAGVRHGPAGGAVAAGQGRSSHRRRHAASRRGLRGVHGLVRPRAVVARAQLLAGAHALHAGPVRRAGRRAPALHAHAQDGARAAARPALPRHQGRLLRQDLHRRGAAVQGAGCAARRGAVAEQAAGAAAPQAQPQGQEGAQRRRAHQRPDAPARRHQHVHRHRLPGRLQRQPGQALPVRARHPHPLAHLHPHQLAARHESEHAEEGHAHGPEWDLRPPQRPSQHYPGVAQRQPGRLPRAEPCHAQPRSAVAPCPPQVPGRARAHERCVA